MTSFSSEASGFFFLLLLVAYWLSQGTGRGRLIVLADIQILGAERFEATFARLYCSYFCKTSV